MLQSPLVWIGDQVGKWNEGLETWYALNTSNQKEISCMCEVAFQWSYGVKKRYLFNIIMELKHWKHLSITPIQPTN